MPSDWARSGPSYVKSVQPLPFLLTYEAFLPRAYAMLHSGRKTLACHRTQAEKTKFGGKTGF